MGVKTSLKKYLNIVKNTIPTSKKELADFAYGYLAAASGGIGGITISYGQAVVGGVIIASGLTACFYREYCLANENRSLRQKF